MSIAELVTELDRIGVDNSALGTVIRGKQTMTMELPIVDIS